MYGRRLVFLQETDMRKLTVIIYSIFLLDSCSGMERRTGTTVDLLTAINVYYYKPVDAGEVFEKGMNFYSQKMGQKLSINKDQNVLIFTCEPNNTYEINKDHVLSDKIDWNAFFKFLEPCTNRESLKKLNSVQDAFHYSIVASLGGNSTYYYPDSLAHINYKGAGIGVEIGDSEGKFYILKTMPDSPAEKAGLKPNDRILIINHHEASQMTLNNVANEFRGDPGSMVDLVVERNNVKISFNIERKVVWIKDFLFKKIDPDSRLIKIDYFSSGISGRIAEDLKSDNTKLLIIDLQNNTGGLLAESYKLADLFIEPDLYMGEIAFRGNSSKYLSANRDKKIFKKIIILMNKKTSGAAEIFSDILQHYKKAILIGNGSGNVNTVDQIFSLSKNTAVKLTTGRIIRANGKPLQDSPLIPDHPEDVDENYEYVIKSYFNN